ncbi:hypothetical protein [Pedobacter sp. B4-66]|uniref:hypothetical protein n=1 Tax=Pedobacter sp. B4-66 TaxID=2817280 RepID=UPI001BDB1436|nr:hypothetical protein [Pedobacter sp. B4-66]
MKKVFFGLAVAVVALSASAFTNVKSFDATTKFYQTVEGTYSRTNPGVICSQSSSNACTVEFPSTLPGTITSFNISQLPTLEGTYGTTSKTANGRP